MIDKPKYRVLISLPEETPAMGPLCFSSWVGRSIATKFLEDTKAGRTQEECLAEIKADLEKCFYDGWAVIEGNFKEMGRK